MPNSIEAAYGYRPEDITVLKDDPAFPIHLQPTRENIVSAFSIVFPWPDLYGTNFGLWAGFSCAN
jgi:hypothetical protein